MGVTFACQRGEREMPEGDAGKVVTRRNQNSDQNDKMKRRFNLNDKMFLLFDTDRHTSLIQD